MRLRWDAAGMIAAEAQYRRVKGYRQLDTLGAALAARVSSHPDADRTNDPVSQAS